MAFDSEFNAYLKQKIHEISDYFSSNLVCDIKEENLKKQLKKLYNNDEYAYEKVKNSKFCLSVVCEDGGFKIKSTAFGEDKISATQEAFRLLNKQLSEILDEQVSEKKRIKEISDSYESHQIKH